MLPKLFTLVISLCILVGKAVSEEVKPSFTKEEIKWLDEHKHELTFGRDIFWPPLGFIGRNEKPAGIVADYVKIFEKKLGTKFKIQQFPTWPELLNALRNSEVDFIGSINNSPRYHDQLSFTDSYMELPLVILTRSSSPKIDSSDKLNNMHLAAVDGYSSIEYVKEQFPKAAIDVFDSDLTALLQTSFGHTDGTIIDLASASYLIDKYKINNLTVGIELDYKWQISFATAKQNIILLSILNKLITSIDQQEKNAIYEKWTHLGSGKTSLLTEHSESIAFTIMLVILIIIAIVLYNRSLKSQITDKTSDLEKEVEKKKKALAKAKESKENYQALFNHGALPKWIYDVKSLQILKVNQTAITHYGYSEEEFLSMSIKDIRPSEDLPKLLNINRTSDTMDSSHYLGIWRHLKKDGEVISVEVYGYAIEYKGKKCKSISFIDVTRQLLDEQLLKDFADNLERKVDIRTEELFAAHKILLEQHKEIEDSIQYAKKIQYAIFPKIKEFKKIFHPSFIFFRPKNVVSGDFYWCCEFGQYRYAVVGDCTGHGVPGALLTMVGNQLLKQTIGLKKILDPSKMLAEMDSEINRLMKYDTTSARDGMDMAICRVDQSKNELVYAGARISLFHGKKELLSEVKADKRSVGGGIEPSTATIYNEHYINYTSGETIYLTTDGFFDQFGGEKDKKLSKRRFRELISSVKNQPIRVQCNKIVGYFKKWKGDQEQTDDVLMVGIKL